LSPNPYKCCAQHKRASHNYPNTCLLSSPRIFAHIVFFACNILSLLLYLQESHLPCKTKFKYYLSEIEIIVSLLSWAALCLCKCSCIYNGLNSTMFSGMSAALIKWECLGQTWHFSPLIGPTVLQGDPFTTLWM
jgi:hypothetical protein